MLSLEEKMAELLNKSSDKLGIKVYEVGNRDEAFNSNLLSVSKPIARIRKNLIYKAENKDQFKTSNLIGATKKHYESIQSELPVIRVGTKNTLEKKEHKQIFQKIHHKTNESKIEKFNWNDKKK